MGILKKVQFYKRALQVLLALNVAMLTAGGIATVSYFGSVQFMKVLTVQNMHRLNLLESMETDLIYLASIAPNKKPDQKQIRHLESLRFKLEEWPDTNLAQIVLPENLEDAGVNEQLVLSIHQRIVREQKFLRDQIQDGSEKLGSLAKQLMILGFSILIFGILLPIVLFKRLQTEITVARHKVEEKVSHWIAGWFESHSQHEESPFQDPVFWIKVVLLSAETFAPQSSHPFMQFIGEFAPTLRKEIEKERKQKEKAKKVA
jgi:hypothetical protein